MNSVEGRLNGCLSDSRKKPEEEPYSRPRQLQEVLLADLQKNVRL